MTTKEMAKVMLAADEGAKIQVRSLYGYKWHDIPNPAWSWNSHHYRVKPAPGEIWVNIYDTGGQYIHPSEEQAKRLIGSHGYVETKHYREVEDDN